jgi:hypothetical protein
MARPALWRAHNLRALTAVLGLYCGCQRWWRKPSRGLSKLGNSQASFIPRTHSDILPK